MNPIVSQANIYIYIHIYTHTLYIYTTYICIYTLHIYIDIYTTYIYIYTYTTYIYTIYILYIYYIIYILRERGINYNHKIPSLFIFGWLTPHLHGPPKPSLRGTHKGSTFSATSGAWRCQILKKTTRSNKWNYYYFTDIKNMFCVYIYILYLYYTYIMYKL
jgi:hypothetical protein